MNIGHGHVPKPFNAEQVLRAPGARVDLDRQGEFVVRLPTQTGRLIAWLRPSGPAPSPLEHSRAKMAARYALETDRSQRAVLNMREGQVLSPRARAANQSRNHAVAEAFIRQIQTTTAPQFQARVIKDVRERVVELPPKVFANVLAWQARGAQASAEQYARDLQALRSDLTAALAEMPGAARLPAAKRDQLIDHSMGLHHADAAALDAQVQSPETYVERALTALKLSPSELRERASASAVLARSVRHSGISHTHVALQVDRFQALAASLKPDEFRAQLSNLRDSVITEAAQSPVRLANARARLEACAKALQPAFEALAGRQLQRKTPVESNREFEQRERAFKAEYGRAVTAQVDLLTEHFGGSVDRVAADQVFWKEGLRDLAPGRLIQDALKHLLADQARAGRAADDATEAAYLNAMLTALNNARTEARPARR